MIAKAPYRKVKRYFNKRGRYPRVIPIKKKWFEMILSGEKKEDYREVTEYWITRLLDYSGLLGYQDIFIFRNGFRLDSPAFAAEVETCRQLGGNPEWGAKAEQIYIVIRIKRVIGLDD